MYLSCDVDPGGKASAEKGLGVLFCTSTHVKMVEGVRVDNEGTRCQRVEISETIVVVVSGWTDRILGLGSHNTKFHHATTATI